MDPAVYKTVRDNKCQNIFAYMEIVEPILHKVYSITKILANYNRLFQDMNNTSVEMIILNMIKSKMTFR